MMYALAVLLLIAINIHGQKEECTLAPELIKVYEDFHHERYPTGRYVTVKFKNDVYEKAKEELNEPGKYSNDRTYKSIRRSMSLPNDDTPIEKQVENVLRKKFVLKVHQLKLVHPTKFGCTGKFKDAKNNEHTLEIVCLYERDRKD
ncbi:hypothetical protein Q1695_004493 [Nippostrongylus brasiliensis]|nr:hypothetical protein Q1695_004493 [Nippostrongylus brasiliensis]